MSSYEIGSYEYGSGSVADEDRIHEAEFLGQWIEDTDDKSQVSELALDEQLFASGCSAHISEVADRTNAVNYGDLATMTKIQSDFTSMFLPSEDQEETKCDPVCSILASIHAIEGVSVPTGESSSPPTPQEPAIWTSNHYRERDADEVKRPKSMIFRLKTRPTVSLSGKSTQSSLSKPGRKKNKECFQTVSLSQGHKVN